LLFGFEKRIDCLSVTGNDFVGCKKERKKVAGAPEKKKLSNGLTL